MDLDDAARKLAREISETYDIFYEIDEDDDEFTELVDMVGDALFDVHKAAVDHARTLLDAAEQRAAAEEAVIEAARRLLNSHRDGRFKEALGELYNAVDDLDAAARQDGGT